MIQTLIKRDGRIVDFDIRDKIVKCPDEVCHWVQFRNVCGVQIGIADIESLVSKEKLRSSKE